MNKLSSKPQAALEQPRREYLTFRLDREEYGIEILKVQEIRGYEQPTRIANAPDFIKGVIQSARCHRAHCGHAYTLSLSQRGGGRQHGGHHSES